MTACGKRHKSTPALTVYMQAMIAPKQIVTDRNSVMKRAGHGKEKYDECQCKDDRSVVRFNRFIKRVHTFPLSKNQKLGKVLASSTSSRDCLSCHSFSRNMSRRCFVNSLGLHADQECR